MGIVNYRGGAGKNIEDDLIAQEIYNKCSKSIVQRMGDNKTLNSISKICRATTGINKITEAFLLFRWSSQKVCTADHSGFLRG